MYTNDPIKSMDSRRVIPLTQWNDYHPWPNQSGLRHLVFNAKHNGFSDVIRRAGRRILIDEAAFFVWLDSSNQQQEVNHG